MMSSNKKAGDRRLVAVLACRNTGSRLYGKPLQNLDVEAGVTILDHIIDCLKSIHAIQDIVLAIAQGPENEGFVHSAKKHRIRHIFGDEEDVLMRLIKGARAANASDIFRVTSESPFVYFDAVDNLWAKQVDENHDCVFLDDIVQGCGFEILKLTALEQSHQNGDRRHRSELCTLYIRENPGQFKVSRYRPPESLIRKDLRLTVDYPEDLVVCRNIYMHFRNTAPRIPVKDIVGFLDKHQHLKQLVEPYTKQGYSSMYLWNDS